MQMLKQILMICDDAPNDYTADNGKMKDNPQQIYKARSKTTFVLVYTACEDVHSVSACV